MEENTRRPQNPRRRRKTRAEIIKETYLPTMILILTVILVMIFIVGSLSRRSDAKETTPPESTADTGPSVDIYAEEVQRLMREADALAADYDYQAAADLIDTFSGDITAYPALTAKKDEYLQANASMITWSDPGQVTCLSFHTLIADTSRAFSNKNYGTAYNRNFVTTEEFSKILQQLYDKGYILVSLEDFTSCTTDDSGRTVCEAKELKLPLGKKPLLLIQTNANYYTYMVDGDGDGIADKDGAGFASRMLVDENGKITCEMVTASGETVTGNYDLVPILNDFIASNPDFSYKGAKAILAPSGYDGIFGYRIDSATKAKKSTEYYNEQVAGATELVNALRADGYELACYTYSNGSYGGISASEIQTDLRSWASEITPVFGETNILVYAQNSEIEEYSGSKFNVLQNADFRYYIGFNSGTGSAKVGENYILLKRLAVTGSQMAHSSVYSNLFDAASVLDPARGTVPQ